jgi:hypothetical protein
MSGFPPSLDQLNQGNIDVGKGRCYDVPASHFSDRMTPKEFFRLCAPLFPVCTVFSPAACNLLPYFPIFAV